MKKLLLSLVFIGPRVYGQIPVTDIANLTHNEIAHIEQMAKWVESIEQLKQQLEQTEEQIKIQSDLRAWKGNPADIAKKIILGKLSFSELTAMYGKDRSILLSRVDAASSIASTGDGLFHTLLDVGLDGKPVGHDAQTHKRYSFISDQHDNYQKTYSDTKARETELEQEIANSLTDLKNASTDAEVEKQSAKIQALTGQLSQVAAQRHDQADQLMAQKIVNDSRIEQERIAASELEAKDDYLANQRVSGYLSSTTLQKNTP